MTFRRSFGGAVAVLGVVAAGSGCSSGKSCPTITVTNSSTASLYASESASETSRGEMLDAAGAQPAVFLVSALATDLGGMSPDAEATDPQCVTTRYSDGVAGFSIAMACPGGAGTFSLEALGATVCQVDADCRKLAGTLNVKSFALPCPGEAKACGRLDAEISITQQPAGTAGPAVSGTGLLTYFETLVPGTCASYPLPE